LRQKKIEIRPSTNPRAGVGLFALEFIPNGTVILECGDPTYSHDNTIDRKVNDLAYNGSSLYYDDDANIEANTNIGYYVKGYNNFPTIAAIPSEEIKNNNANKCYFIAIKDIAEGEELSRHYGLRYWREYEQRIYYGTPGIVGQSYSINISDTYVFVDSVRQSITMNTHKNLYSKYVDGKYYYILPLYNKKYVDVTKPDYSRYQLSEEIVKNINNNGDADNIENCDDEYIYIIKI
jgi:hypothetical protein